MSRAPLMPKATAVWLVDNTSLTFRQIADFCQLHELEVKGIADGDVAQGIKGMDPITSGQLTREELEKGQADSGYRLKIAEPKVDIPITKAPKGPRYTPVSRRQDRPDAIAWLLRYHPELPDSQIMKLVGTTKPTIQAIRERTHWNSANIKPVDPVSLGLCSQLDLDLAVQKAAKRAAKLKQEGAPEPAGATLLPASETLAPEDAIQPQAEIVEQSEPEEALEPFANLNAEPERTEEDEEYDPDSVFAKLKALKPEDAPAEDDQQES